MFEGQTGNFGFNAATGEYGDMVEMGVLDRPRSPALALQHAASVAGLMLTTDRMIAELPEGKNRNAWHGRAWAVWAA